MADTNNVSLTIGSVTFADFEIPQEINFGTDQMLAINKMIGGQRDIQALGSDPRPITWSGRFRGTDATDRADSLDLMAQNGLPVDLTWYSYSRTVLIKSFDAKFMQFYEVPYTITVEVLSNNDTASQTAQNTASDAINGQLSTASDQAASTGNQSIIASVGNISALANNAGGLSNVPTSTASSACTAATANTNAAFTGQMTAIDSGLSTTGTPTQMAMGNIGAAGNYNNAFSIMQTQNTLTNMQTNINGL